jgi:hypothetical protein
MRWHLSLGLIILIIASAFAGGVVIISAALSHSETPATVSHVTSKVNTTARHIVLPKQAVLKNTSAPAELEENMTLLSNSMQQFQYTSQNLSAEVTSPPFVIDLSVVPKEIIDAKWYINRTLSKREEISQVTRASEGAFLEMAVYNAVTGELVARDGFGRDYSIDQHRTIEIYQPGKYIVNLYGNEVTVRSVLSMKKPESPGVISGGLS